MAGRFVGGGMGEAVTVFLFGAGRLLLLLNRVVLRPWSDLQNKEEKGAAACCMYVNGAEEATDRSRGDCPWGRRTGTVGWGQETPQREQEHWWESNKHKRGMAFRQKSAENVSEALVE